MEEKNYSLYVTMKEGEKQMQCNVNIHQLNTLKEQINLDGVYVIIVKMLTELNNGKPLNNFLQLVNTKKITFQLTDERNNSIIDELILPENSFDETFNDKYFDSLMKFFINEINFKFNKNIKFI